MAIIPLKQLVKVIKPGEVDKWGKTQPTTPITLKCRADERTEVVTNSVGNESVSSVQFLFDKLPDISYDDVLEFTNELDITIKRKPINIQPIRMINGKAIMTEVHL